MTEFYKSSCWPGSIAPYPWLECRLYTDFYLYSNTTDHSVMEYDENRLVRVNPETYAFRYYPNRFTICHFIDVTLRRTDGNGVTTWGWTDTIPFYKSNELIGGQWNTIESWEETTIEEKEQYTSYPYFTSGWPSGDSGIEIIAIVDRGSACSDVDYAHMPHEFHDFLRHSVWPRPYVHYLYYGWSGPTSGGIGKVEYSDCYYARAPFYIRNEPFDGWGHYEWGNIDQTFSIDPEHLCEFVYYWDIERVWTGSWSMNPKNPWDHIVTELTYTPTIVEYTDIPTIVTITVKATRNPDALLPLSSGKTKMAIELYINNDIYRSEFSDGIATGTKTWTYTTTMDLDPITKHLEPLTFYGNLYFGSWDINSIVIGTGSVDIAGYLVITDEIKTAGAIS